MTKPAQHQQSDQPRGRPGGTRRDGPDRPSPDWPRVRPRSRLGPAPRPARGPGFPPLGQPAARSSSGSNSTATSPKRRVLPGVSAISPVIRSPSTKVPLVEPRSVSTQRSSRRWSLAWVVLTLGSEITTSLYSARPMLTTGDRTASRWPLNEPLRTSSEASGAGIGARGVTTPWSSRDRKAVHGIGEPLPGAGGRPERGLARGRRPPGTLAGAGGRVGIEAELVVPDPDHVGPGQEMPRPESAVHSRRCR